MSRNDMAGDSDRGVALVTGADGRIGRAVVERLVADGWHVRGLSLSYGDDVVDTGSVEFVAGDATNEADVAAAMRDVDTVVHLAALPHWDAGTPVEVYRTNVLSTFTVLTLAAQCGVRRAVLASSVHATGVSSSPHQPLPDVFPLGVDDRLQHADWYSLSKSSDELTAAMVTRRWGIATTALRFPLVNTAAVLRESAERWTADPAEGVRLGWGYLDVRDAASLVSVVIDADRAGAERYAVAAPETLVPYATEELLSRYAPQVPRTRRFDGREAPIDIVHLASRFGFVPQYPFDVTGLAPIAGLPIVESLEPSL